MEEEAPRPAEQPEAAIKPASAPKTPYIIGAVVLLVLVIAGGAYAMAHRSREERPVGTNSPQTRESAQPSNSSGGNPPDANGLISATLPLECVPKGHDNYRTEDTLAVDPTDANIAYVGIEYKGFFKTTDGGATWKESDAGLRGYGMESDPSKRCIAELGRTVIDPADHTHLLLSRIESPGDLSTLFTETAGIYESKDAGATWKQLLKPGMNASGSQAIAFDPKSSSNIYYGSNNMQPSYTVNGGRAIDKYFNTNGILYHTADAGATWSELPTGAAHGFRAINVGIDPADNNKLWLFTLNANVNGGSPVESDQQSVLVSADKGATWTSLADKLPAGYRTLAGGKLSPTNGQNAFVVSSVQTGMGKDFATTNGGATWTAANVYVLAADYDPNDRTGKRMLGYAPFESTPGIYQSLDGGVTWAYYAALPSEVDNQANLGVRVSSFAWSASTPSTVYMDASGGLAWKSTDNGKTWKTVLTLDTVGGKNKNKDGQEVSREPDGSSGGSAVIPSAAATSNPSSSGAGNGTGGGSGNGTGGGNGRR